MRVLQRWPGLVDVSIPPSDPLPEPAAAPVAPATVAAGPMIAPIDRIKLFGPTEWEEFVVEWADSLKSNYVDVRRLGGAGDQGRDVIGIADDGSWDNYQCKHYAQPLAPHQVWTEIGKLICYTRSGSFERPRRYFFLAPQGVGTRLSNLVRQPKRLRKELLDNWTAHCETKITSTANIALDDPLREYINAFDFSIFGTVAPHRLIDAHAKTRWHVARFGGGLPTRPTPDLPPAEPTPAEAPYVRALLDAYADHLKLRVAALEDLPDDSQLGGHFADARREFYSAEALRAFSRDTLPPGSFEELQDQVHSGIGDDLRDDHVDGYRRLRAVVATARVLALDGHSLNTSMAPRDRGGICHQLANDGTIETWVR
jgi:hypothetical protein